jgi:nicotinamide-nucleotide amidase
MPTGTDPAVRHHLKGQNYRVSDPAELTEDAAELAAMIARRLRQSERTVSVAESLTSGSLACHLGAAEEASEWFVGGVTAYASHVKFEVLGVDPGPVITARCARQMARGVARLTRSDVGVGITGVGGPDPVEGRPPGTVFIAVSSAEGEKVAAHQFDGDASEVVRAATVAAFSLLLSVVS